MIMHQTTITSSSKNTVFSIPHIVYTNYEQENFSYARVYEENEQYNEIAPHILLYIDNNYNIILPEHGNINIKLDPLPKSLYILFLRHPEGFLLKHIAQYATELEVIYRVVSARRNNTVIKRIITEITNPTNNMLHKNLSIIRAAFIKALGLEEAQNYIPVHCKRSEEYVKLGKAYIQLPWTLQ